MKSILLLLFSIPLYADLQMKVQVGLEKPYQTHMIYASDSHYRVDLEHQGAKMSLIYNYDEKTYFMIQHKDKAYQVIDQNKMKLLAQQVRESQQLMKATQESILSQLPPEQRAKYKKRFAEEKKPDVLQFQKLDTEKIGKFKVQKYKAEFAKNSEQNVWVLPYQKLGLKPKDFSLYQKMIRSMSSISKVMNPDPSQDPLSFLVSAKAFAGQIPLKTEVKESGVTSLKSEIKGARSKKLKKSLFRMPKDYNKVEAI